MITHLTTNSPEADSLTRSLALPYAKDSHKGQNGRVLIIGGSQLFHSSVIWSAEVASRIVDIVHLVSPSAQNQAIFRTHLKKALLDGIVVPYCDLETYIQEDDVVLIGPGMPRADGQEPGDIPTAELVNHLVSKYPHKKWVIDGGALQTINLKLLTDQMIITPHHREWQRFQGQSLPSGLTILLKGATDTITTGDQVTTVSGGNPGLTKGGTGDVLAGLVAGFYALHPAHLAAIAASLLNKQAAEALATTRGYFFNSTDLVTALGKILASSW